MVNWENVILGPKATIREAMETIGRESLRIALITSDENYKLLGVVTDGDIRRGLLKKFALEDPVTKIMKKTPIVVGEKTPKKTIQDLLVHYDIQHLPVVNEKGEVCGIETLSGFFKKSKKSNWVFLLAGGLGTRLRPLTDNCPKPLLNVGDRPILENIIESFANKGFYRFYISVNYKAQMVMDYFQKGEKWGVEIEYVKESKPLGTAGALGLIPKKMKGPIIIMNGDLLTKVDFTQLLDFHQQGGGMATVCMREFEFQVPYGVIQTKDQMLTDICEKPQYKFFVNAGIYVLDPAALELIETNEYLDMTGLIERLKAKNHKIAVFPIHEYWLDIGRMDDLQKAQMEVFKFFN